VKVKIRNYQAIESAELDISGFTAITGESNRGKSAILRAIRSALLNSGGSSCIKKGESFADVVLSVPGKQVRWARTSAGVQYDVDGKTIEKIGRTIPREVESLGIQSLSVGGKKYYPQVARQHDSLFILGEDSPAVTAELLAATQASQKVSLAVKVGQKDLRDRKVELRVLNEQLDSVTVRLSALQTFSGSLSERLKTLQELGDRIKVSRNRLEKLRVLKGRMREALRSQTILMAVKTQRVPAKVDFDRSWMRVSILKRYLRVQVGLRVQAQVSTWTVPSPLGVGGRYFKVKGISNRLGKVSGLSSPKCEIPTIQLSTNRLSCLTRLRDRRRGILKEKEKLFRESDEARVDLAKTERETRATLQTLGYCPVCGKQGKNND